MRFFTNDFGCSWVRQLVWPWFPIILLGLCCELRALDFFELEPTLYNSSKPKNAVEELRLEKGFGEGVHSESEFLELVLRSLRVPESSQVLVYSKTSAQRDLISMASPRAIYFNDATYVGYVRGGSIEVAIHDENLGMAFYLIQPPRVLSEKPKIERPNSCLDCHVSSRTSDVPGVFIRSVSVDEKTERLQRGSFDTTHTSPYAERWGGWFVTGDWDANGHMGNTSSIRRQVGEQTMLKQLDFLSDVYPRKTSDVVALAVLEHQCMVHNALVMARLRYDRAWFLYQAIDSKARQDDEVTSAWRVADSVAENLVERLLFVDEAEMLGDGLAGDNTFVKDFESAHQGHVLVAKLRKLRSVGRLFKYRCSYMIHSDAFKLLPAPVKRRVFFHLNQALTQEGHENGKHLGTAERAAILNILQETTDWRQFQL